MARPNVLLVCADDLGYGDLGRYGADVPTPNLDRLVDRGVRFTDFHANGPICSPTRASLLTGRYPQRAGMPANGPEGHPETDPPAGLPTDQETLATLLGEAGYLTGAFGKWHLGMTEADDPIAHGFDEFFGFRSGCVDYYSHLQVWIQEHGIAPYHDLWEDRTEVWENGRYVPHLITDRATSFLEGDRPFFAYVAYDAPHYPLHAPERYQGAVDHLDGERARYGAMVAVLDEAVGDLLDALDREGITDDTIVWFTSDHGPSREVRNHLDGSTTPFRGGETGGFRGHKFSLFEGGIRIPSMVAYPPAIDAGGNCDGLAATMDVPATLLDLCGVDVPDAFDGRSLRGMLADGASTPHDRLYWSFGEQSAVRAGDWKLVLDGIEIPPDADDTEHRVVEGGHLSNLAGDPGETENVAAEHPDRAAALEADLREWL